MVSAHKGRRKFQPPQANKHRTSQQANKQTQHERSKMYLITELPSFPMFCFSSWDLLLSSFACRRCWTISPIPEAVAEEAVGDAGNEIECNGAASAEKDEEDDDDDEEEEHDDDDEWHDEDEAAGDAVLHASLAKHGFCRQV